MTASDVKPSLGITTTTFDSEINENIAVALADMGLTDITNLDATDTLIAKAVKTYCAYMHNLMHGNPDQAERFKTAYDEQKRMLIVSSDYTTYDDDEDDE